VLKSIDGTFWELQLASSTGASHKAQHFCTVDTVLLTDLMTGVSL
jgi:hypothetical protein